MTSWKRWTDKEVDFLKKNSCMPNRWLASTLGRTVAAVAEKKHNLDIHVDDELTFMPEKLTQQEKEIRIIKLAADMRIKLKGWE